MISMNIQTETTQKDWEDFWYSPEKFGKWYPEDFVEEDEPDTETAE